MNYRYRDKSELKQVELHWFSLVPNNWNVLMFKRIVKSVKNGIWGDEPKQNEDDIPCIRILNFTRNEMEVNIDDLTTRNIPILKQRDYILRKGDLLIEKSGGGEKNPVGFVARYNHDLPAVYANFMAKISLNENEAKSDYIKYLCSNIYNKRIHLDSVNQTTGIQNLDTETYFKRVIPLPNINEQEKIAKFLDEKTEQFDSIISKKETLIEKLEEAKKSLISEVVTGKVKVVKSSDGYELVERKKEEMKDSGVEWLGDIPREWDIKRLKYLFEIKKDIAGKLGYDVLSVTQSGIKIKDITKNEGQLSMDYSKYQFVEISDFIMNHMDLLTGFVDCSKFNGVTSPDYRVFKLKNNNNCKEYYNFIFQSCYYNRIFYGLAQGVSGMGRWRLQTDKFLNFVLPLPSINEQRIIAEIVEKKIDEFKKLKDRLELNIEKLKKAKQSLISEAVTGKIEILD